jgi:membrane protease YdiL (CAAX protease family)
MSAFIRKHPVVACFVVTFAISWGGVLLLLGGDGLPRTRKTLDEVLPYAIAIMIVGPASAGLLLTAVAGGGTGLRDLISRLLKWRVGIRWYAAALLLAPLLTLTVLLALSLVSPVFIPGIIATDDKMSRLMFGLAAALGAGTLEELGWTGFATPRLRRRYGILATGLLVGVVWGAWHIMGQVVLASGTYSGSLSPRQFVITGVVGLLFGSLPAYRVLMVWVYDRTDSLLVAILMHASLTAATIVLEPLAISGTALLVYSAVSIAAWWIVVAAVAMATHGQLSRRRLQPRVA